MPMRRTWILLAMLCLLIGGIMLLENTKVQVPKDSMPLMLEATARTRRAFEALRAERQRLHLPLDAADDPNDTGMIGPMYTDITTTLGALDAKRSTTNPNVAAMLVDMLLSLNLVPGDHIAVNLSGSFPCLNIALLCAMDTLGLEGTVIFSVGASTYGATLPDFTYGDMEHFLYTKGLLQTRSTAFSMGGENDLGLEMPDDTRRAIAERLSGFGYAVFSSADYQENLSARLTVYETGDPVRCFVNVGGNLFSLGPSGSMHTVPGGIVRTLPADEDGGGGLVQYFVGKDIPVIHLLNMKGLLPAYGLPIDPVPLPTDGAGGVYCLQTYSRPLLSVLIALSLSGLVILWRTQTGKNRSRLL